MIIKFILPLKAVAKQRPRLSKHGTYTPKETKAFENIIKLAYGNRYCFNEEYIKVKIIFRFKVPKYYNKKQYEEALEGILRPTKADLDNYIKSVLDGLNRKAWIDDRYIVKLEAEKVYSTKDEIEIIIQNI